MEGKLLREITKGGAILTESGPKTCLLNMWYTLIRYQGWGVMQRDSLLRFSWAGQRQNKGPTSGPSRKEGSKAWDSILVKERVSVSCFKLN